MKGKYRVVTTLLYDNGLRTNEALQIGIKEIDFNQRSIFVFRGKKGKERYIILPRSLIQLLQQQIEKSKQVRQRDVTEGFGLTSLPASLIRKYCNATKDPCWQYGLPSSTRCTHPHDGYICRHHIHHSA